ncbi:tRNA wybutosine-synthesizing protein [Lasallia pustulata]|uniref:tRNA(Phe) 7-[(3-amino-3-carboxypropyl)-4-demethylwyosine(37)-N(4)]-methyltransferase n=1 Tax=Lasallia pustulata TaxID=136370 RepID=A0A1W5DDM7_9LECA|nr:tRNA wybutosine-synthesizing protein [Lasallia pustulata]
MPAIPAAFAHKKQKILDSLAIPDAEYTDLSPKGSVDEGIRDLINNINGLDGIVTTSSCAGRISVFLEGSKELCESANAGSAEAPEDQSLQATVPGGKGRGGRWLFVSHDPLMVPPKEDLISKPLTELFGLSTQEHIPKVIDPSKTCFVRFQFEPMILHIMTASLQHAQRVLSAAINAGFRESGVQSLKNLDDPNAFPMVAVRTAGLALGSIVGCTRDHEGVFGVQSLVNEEYLQTLLNIANERFQANAERIERFSAQLFKNTTVQNLDWEDPEARRERKRAEGLRRQQEVHESRAATNTAYVRSSDQGEDNDQDILEIPSID